MRGATENHSPELVAVRQNDFGSKGLAYDSLRQSQLPLSQSGVKGQPQAISKANQGLFDSRLGRGQKENYVNARQTLECSDSA